MGEYCRSTSMTELNTILREQIDHAHLVNQQLTDDLCRVSSELQQVRDEFTKKTRDWQEEERVWSLNVQFFSCSFILFIGI